MSGARLSDPQTSHDAARTVPQDCEIRVLHALVRVHRDNQYRGGNQHEVAVELARTGTWRPYPNSVSKRLGVLARRGWVQVIEERRQGCSVYTPTVAGRIALDRASEVTT